MTMYVCVPVPALIKLMDKNVFGHSLSLSVCLSIQNTRRSHTNNKEQDICWNLRSDGVSTSIRHKFKDLLLFKLNDNNDDDDADGGKKQSTIIYAFWAVRCGDSGDSHGHHLSR